MASPTTYAWRGRDRFGRKLDGQLSAPAPSAVRAELARRGIKPTRIRRQRSPERPGPVGTGMFGLGRGRRVGTADVALFSRQMATMIRAGVPLVQAFDVIAGGARSPRFASMIGAVRSDLAAGSSLSMALASFPAQFNDLYRNLVAVGEQSGNLENMLERIAAYQERTEAIRNKLRKAMTYPLLVTLVALVVTGILLVHVVPQFEAVFASAGADLPAFTRAVLGLSESLREQWPVLVLFAGGAVGGIIVFRRRSRWFRDALDRLLLKAPVAGGILSKASVARCARTLSTSVAAGVPLVEALGSVAGSTGNAVYAAAVGQIREQVAAGQPLHACMRETGKFPDMMVQMVAIGEQSGSLDDMLDRSATHFEVQVDAAVDNLTALVEPAMMAVLGVLIGGLIVAMYLPVFQLGSTFGG